MGRGSRPSKGRAKPAISRKPSKNDSTKVGDLEKRLTAALRSQAEAQDQQTATAEILRVIKRSPTDVKPVFDAIIRSAVRLCGALYGIVWRYDGETVHLGAGHNLSAIELKEFQDRYPRPIGSRQDIHRMMLLGRVIDVPDIDQAAEVPPILLANWRRREVHSAVIVPMQHDHGVIGAIGVSHRKIGAFSPSRVELLKTFADQAVIAIENVRLFKELQTRNKDLTEALDQQTATSEILRVISSSPTDIQPVFAAVATSAARLCDAFDAAIHRIDGDVLRLVAHDGPIEADTVLSIGQGSFAGHVVREQRAMHVADLQAEEGTYPLSAQFARHRGFRTILSVPMLRGTEALGIITIRRAEVRPFTERQAKLLQTFADQAVIAIENVRLFKELELKNRDLTTALEQQTATSEVLKVISRSTFDLEPVLATLVENATRLAGAEGGLIHQFDGEVFRLVAECGASPAYREYWRQNVIRPGRHSTIGRAALERRTIHIVDILADPEWRQHQAQRMGAQRSVLGVPMLKQDNLVGVFFLWRTEVRAFTDKEIELVTTFADQAVIAIENVRLFNETKEALEQQTATGEILRVISSSPTDLQPVMDAVAENAARVCGATDAHIRRLEGDTLRLVAKFGELPTQMPDMIPVSSQTPGSRSVTESRTIHIDDIVPLLETEYRGVKSAAIATGARTHLATPLMRKGVPIGVILIRRTEVRPFTDKQVALLQTFADQAVIAIENVRLFTELQEKNRALTQAHAQVTEALEQQTATAEILRVISSSPTDIQPVFEAIAESAVRLCKADYGSANRLEGDVIHLVAHKAHPLFTGLGQSTQWLAAARRLFPHPLTRDLIAGGAMLDREVVHLEDIQSDIRFPASRTLARTMGYRTALSVPMLRDSGPVGAIVVFRQEGRPFSEAEIGLLQTFADQAVIAIENVRLFTELQARTHELTRSVGQLTALGEVARAVSSTLDLDTVLSTIVSRAIQLSGTDGGSVYEYDEATEEFSLRASRELPEAYVDQVKDARPRKGEGAVGRVAQTREPVQIADISDPAAYESRVRNTLLQMGLRALLAVPLIAEDRLVGALIVMRKRAGTFAAEEVALLQTFAIQSALAIQNARLFREIEIKSRQLEVASQHKSEFLANMSHELRTPLNAIIGFSEVLSDRMFGELNEKQEEYLKDIYASGTHLLSLINDILDLSKIEAGRMELELTEFDLPTALDNALMLVRERAQRRSLALHKDVDAGVGQIQGDERKIRQVVLNLLSNAIKFTPEGGRVELAAVPKDGGVEISVSDTGVGIAPEDQEKVFEEFRQVGTADKKAEGTGLGLTLCRKFIELHGGKIWVESQLSQGSTFTFTIPTRHGE